MLGISFLVFFPQTLKRMKFAVFAVCALFVCCAYAGAPTFTVCSDASASLTDVKVSSPDPDWKGGATVSFTVTGKLTKPIEAGSHVDTIAYFAGMEVENKKDDLCTYEGTPFKCPEAAGTHTWTFPFAIPNIPFPDTLSSHSDFKNADGSSILCLDLKVDL